MKSKNPVFLIVWLVTFLLGSFYFPNPGYSKNKIKTSQKTFWGLHTTSIETPEGNITINLPDDMMAGDTISGTVIPEPTGKTYDEFRVNSDTLNGYVVEVEVEDEPVKKTEVSKADLVKIAIPTGVTTAISVTIKNPKGKKVSKVNVPVLTPTDPPVQPQEVVIPSIGQAGRPVEIPGPFDGTTDNTSVKIGGKNVTVLAESPRKVVAQSPRDVVGQTQIEVKENNFVTKGKMNNLSIRLSAPKTTLLRGEETTVTATIDGFKGLSKKNYPIPFEITNVTPEVVRFLDKPGQAFSKGIEYTQIENGKWIEEISVVGVSPGNFSIMATVFYVSVHNTKKDMNKEEFLAWINSLITMWQEEVAKINKEENDAIKNGKKWPDTAAARGKELRRNLLKEKIRQLEASRLAADGQLGIAKALADKILADVTVVELGAELVGFAFELLGYTDLPVVKLTTVLKGLKAVYKGKKVLKAIESAEKAAKAYEKAKDLEDKAKKLKELKNKVEKVKEAIKEK